MSASAAQQQSLSAADAYILVAHQVGVLAFGNVAETAERFVLRNDAQACAEHQGGRH